MNLIMSEPGQKRPFNYPAMILGAAFATVLLLLISIVTPAAGLLSGQTLWTLARWAWRLTPPTVWLGAVLIVAAWLLILRRAWTVRT
jgi:hypothetical protein